MTAKSNAPKRMTRQTDYRQDNSDVPTGKPARVRKATPTPDTEHTSYNWRSRANLRRGRA